MKKLSALAKIMAGLIVGLGISAFGAAKVMDYAAYKVASQVGSWNVNYDLGRYGDNYLLRAIVAKIGLGALVKEEALYFTTISDAAGGELSGAYRYEMTFPANAMPDVNAFWSLTPYYRETELLVHNELDRFQIGDRSTHLRYGDDGSLTLVIQHEKPADPVALANWLPVPEGQFVLTFRAYEPGTAMLAGDYMPPMAVKVGE